MVKFERSMVLRIATKHALAALKFHELEFGCKPTPLLSQIRLVMIVGIAVAARTATERSLPALEGLAAYNAF